MGYSHSTLLAGNFFLRNHLMSKQKPEKLTASATLEKSRQYKFFVQMEGELTPAQLEALAGGGLNFGN